MPKIIAMNLHDSDQLHGYRFYCPGCHGGHYITTARLSVSEPGWSFNGNMERPTFTPSILVCPSLPPGTPGRCHSHVTDGRIQFLPDSGHALAGQTVDLPECDD